MKQLVSGILLLLLALQAFYPLTIYTYYYANKAYIASALCENKNEPQMNCSGKCFLNKQLKKAQPREEPQKAAVQNFDMAVYLQPALVTSIKPAAHTTIKQYPPLRSQSYYYQHHSSLLRPPQA